MFHAHTGAVQGRDALVAIFSNSLGPSKTVPIAGQLNVRFDGSARAQLKCLMARTFYDGRPGGFFGYHDDELTKVGEEWKFASRNYTFYHRA